MLEVTKKVTQTVVAISASDLADPAAELSVTLPRTSKKVTVDLPAETDRSASALADALEAEVSPDARVGDVLIYHGAKVGHQSLDGVAFVDKELTVSVPYSENTPAAISAVLGGIGGKLT